jgi:hypothetical protein
MATYLPNITDVLPESAGYAPNFSFLDTMLRRRQSMYDQGFAQVSSNYNFINRNVTNPYNLDVRDKFLSQAKKNLKDISAMDLSQQQNVEAARRVFEPFVQNREVLMDMAFTAHMDQQEAIAESYRLKDGGKEFSQDNLDYVRMQRNAFARDTPESVGNYMAEKRYFSPYKNYAAKFEMAYEKFKPTVKKPLPQNLNGQWIVTKETTDVNSEEFKRYLESLLTPEEKRQIEIEGIVKYGSSPNALITAYTDKASSQIKSFTTQLKYYDGQMKLAKTDDEKKQVQSAMDYYNNRIEDINNSVSALTSADPKTLNRIKDKVASDLYYSEKIDQFGKAAERHDEKYDVQASEIWKTIFSNQQQWARQKNEQDFQWKKMMKEDELKRAGTTITGGALSGNSVVLKTSNITSYGVSGVEKDILAAREQISAADQLIVSRLATTGQGTDANTVKAFVDKYSSLTSNMEPVIKNNQLIGYRYRDTKKPVETAVLADLQAFQQWQSAVSPAQMKLTALENAKNQLNAEVKKQAGTDYDVLDKKISAINNGKDLVFSKNGKSIKITNKELFDGMLSGSITFNSVGGGSTFSGPGMSVYSSGTESINVNGIEVPLTDKNPAVVNAVKSIRNLYESKEFKNIKNTRNNIYSSDVINNNSLALFDANSNFFKDRQGDVNQIFGKNMTIRGVDLLSGSLAVSAPDKMSRDEVLNLTKGRANVVYDETNDLFYVKGMKGMNILSTFSPTQQAIYEAAVTPLKGKNLGNGVHILESPPFKIGNLPYDFQWKRITREYPGTDGTKSVNYEYFLYDGNNYKTPLLGSMSDPLQLVTQIGNLGQYPDKAVQLVESLK